MKAPYSDRDVEIARQLDASVQKLRHRALQLMNLLGRTRVGELTEIVERRLDRCGEEEGRRELNLDDKEFIWTLRLLLKAYSEQQRVRPRSKHLPQDAETRIRPTWAEAEALRS
jgi:hypothetical protein